ncbi:hypothetical protein ACCT09_26785, partial [Rhizobium ruizarguesonis]
VLDTILLSPGAISSPHLWPTTTSPRSNIRRKARGKHAQGVTSDLAIKSLVQAHHRRALACPAPKSLPSKFAAHHL